MPDKLPDKLSKISALLFLLLLLLPSSNSYAFSRAGHQVICQLSFTQLSLEKQDKISHLISKIPIEHQHIINKYNHQRKDKKLSFSDICTWADAIKNKDEYNAFKSWHYMNVDRELITISAPCINDCVISAIYFHQKDLVENQDNWGKLQALMFLAHWVGDIHQPLHVGYASDKGGNSSKISGTTCKNLHRLWDHCLLAKNKEEQSTLLSGLEKQWQTLIHEQSNNLLMWQHDSPLIWANESLIIIRQPFFGYCQLDESTACLKRDKAIEPISKQYIKTYTPIAQKRVLQAAIRLHTILNRAL